MRWKRHDPYEWRRVFAWVPIRIQNHTVWLEHYEMRRPPEGFDFEVQYRLIDKNHDQASSKPL